MHAFDASFVVKFSIRNIWGQKIGHVVKGLKIIDYICYVLWHFDKESLEVYLNLIWVKVEKILVNTWITMKGV